MCRIPDDIFHHDRYVVFLQGVHSAVKVSNLHIYMHANYSTAGSLQKGIVHHLVCQQSIKCKDLTVMQIEVFTHTFTHLVLQIFKPPFRILCLSCGTIMWAHCMLIMALLAYMILVFSACIRYQGQGTLSMTTFAYFWLFMT